jgi:hypothetical protein
LCVIVQAVKPRGRVCTIHHWQILLEEYVRARKVLIYGLGVETSRADDTTESNASDNLGQQKEGEAEASDVVLGVGEAAGVAAEGGEVSGEGRGAQEEEGARQEGGEEHTIKRRRR